MTFYPLLTGANARTQVSTPDKLPDIPKVQLDVLWLAVSFKEGVVPEEDFHSDAGFHPSELLSSEGTCSVEGDLEDTYG